ncbi:acyltransferase family protein [Pseudidiomarina homiensis]|uniref:Acyltransferase 3 domain-containing protein n=1 Tax=Pseudidiomarina homiensis TaxID=364198 RepID=A0A432XSF4_9GAMM|nr:hypothetical protein CWI70_12355 [Pseudidiomarina homiensis]
MQTLARSLPQITWSTTRTLDSLRVIACAIVVLSHVYEFVSGNLNNPINESLSYAAVAVFFFISGWVNANSLLRNSVRDFYVKRVKRIYPTYVKAFVLALGLSLVFGIYQPEYLTNLVFLNPFFGTIPTNAPLWSLSYEVLLYAAAPFLLANRPVVCFLTQFFLFLVFILAGHLWLMFAFWLGYTCFSLGLQLPRFEFFYKYGRHTYEIYVYHYLVLVVLWGMF